MICGMGLRNEPAIVAVAATASAARDWNDVVGDLPGRRGLDRLVRRKARRDLPSLAFVMKRTGPGRASAGRPEARRTNRP
jgi:hypothetical protein